MFPGKRGAVKRSPLTDITAAHQGGEGWGRCGSFPLINRSDTVKESACSRLGSPLICTPWRRERGRRKVTVGAPVSCRTAGPSGSSASSRNCQARRWPCGSGSLPARSATSRPSGGPPARGCWAGSRTPWVYRSMPSLENTSCQARALIVHGHGAPQGRARRSATHPKPLRRLTRRLDAVSRTHVGPVARRRPHVSVLPGLPGPSGLPGSPGLPASGRLLARCRM
jgi:hypothetical protein